MQDSVPFIEAQETCACQKAGASTSVVVVFFHSHLGCKDRIDGPRVGAVQWLPNTCEALGPTYRTDKNRAESPLN